jgi:hypothetical protein
MAPPAPQYTLREVALRAANGGETPLRPHSPIDPVLHAAYKELFKRTL